MGRHTLVASVWYFCPTCDNEGDDPYWYRGGPSYLYADKARSEKLMAEGRGKRRRNCGGHRSAIQ